LHDEKQNFLDQAKYILRISIIEISVFYSMIVQRNSKSNSNSFKLSFINIKKAHEVTKYCSEDAHGKEDKDVRQMKILSY